MLGLLAGWTHVLKIADRKLKLYLELTLAAYLWPKGWFQLDISTKMTPIVPGIFH